MEEEIEFLIDSIKEDMDKPLSHLDKALLKLRAGKRREGRDRRGGGLFRALRAQNPCSDGRGEGIQGGGKGRWGRRGLRLLDHDVEAHGVAGRDVVDRVEWKNAES